MYLRFKVWSQQTSQKLTPHSAPECGPNFLLRGGLIVITDWLNSLAKCQKLASTQRVFPQGCCSSESVGTPTGSELRSHKSCLGDFLSVIVNLKCSNFKTLSSCSRDISVFGITLCLSKSYRWEKKNKTVFDYWNSTRWHKETTYFRTKKLFISFWKSNLNNAKDRKL